MLVGFISIALQLRTTGIWLHHNIYHIFIMYYVCLFQRRSLFAKEALLFLSWTFLAMTKIHIICAYGSAQTVPFRKNWKITQTFLFKSAVSAYAALSLSSISWQVGPDPMICVAMQGPGSGSNLAKYFSPWGLFKHRLKAIAWYDISH